MIVLLLLALITVVAAWWWLSRPLRVARLSLAANERADLEQVRDRLLTQLNELDAEQADSGIDSGVARDEERRLSAELAAVLKQLDKSAPSRNKNLVPARTGNSLMISTGLAALLLLVGAGLYFWRNAENIQGFVLASKSGSGAVSLPPMVFEMVSKLEKRLAEQPNDPEGWARLGRSYTVLQRKDKALEAYAKAYALAPDNVAIVSDYAWLVFNENPGETTGLVLTLYTRLAKLAPNHPDAIWFMGYSAFTKGDYRTAIKHWEHLLTLLPPEDPGRQQLQQAIANARAKQGG